jgi:hypothetical protein
MCGSILSRLLDLTETFRAFEVAPCMFCSDCCFADALE